MIFGHLKLPSAVLCVVTICQQPTGFLGRGPGVLKNQLGVFGTIEFRRKRVVCSLLTCAVADACPVQVQEVRIIMPMHMQYSGPSSLGHIIIIWTSCWYDTGSIDFLKCNSVDPVFCVQSILKQQAQSFWHDTATRAICPAGCLLDSLPLPYIPPFSSQTLGRSTASTP